MSRLLTKPTKWHVRPAKTPISLGIRTVWSESSLCAQWVAKDLSFLHADSEDSDQTGWMPRLIWIFTGRTCHFYTLPHKKWRGIMLYPAKILSVCPSVSTSLPDSNLSSFWPIFFKLCMDIDIRGEWFGIANGLNLFINNRVMALFFLNTFRLNGWIMIKFCICIDKYKIHVVSNARYFWSIFNRVMALDQRQILFMLNILWINLWISIKFCICIDIEKM